MNKFGDQFLRYCGLAGLSALVSLGVPVLLHEVLDIAEEAAVAVGFIVTFLLNFFGIRMYVFSNRGSVWPQLRRFALSNISFRAAEYSLFLLLHTVLDIFYLLALFAVLLVSTFLKFGIYRGLVFRSCTREAGQ